MKILFIISLFILNVTSQTNAQTHIVSTNSIVYPQLKSFLLRNLKDTIGVKIALIKEVNLLDSTNYNFGIFTFWTLSSESTPYLYLRNKGENKIVIISKYHIDSIMKYLASFFDENEKYFTYRQRLSCTKRIVDFLELKYDLGNWKPK